MIAALGAGAAGLAGVVFAGAVSAGVAGLAGAFCTEAGGVAGTADFLAGREVCACLKWSMKDAGVKDASPECMCACVCWFLISCCTYVCVLFPIIMHHKDTCHMHMYA